MAKTPKPDWLCSYECAHVDCIEVRGKDPKCVVCTKPVPAEKLFRLGRKKGVYPAHSECGRNANKVQVEEEAAP